MAPQIDAGMQVDIHLVAAEGAQEEAPRPRSTAPSPALRHNPPAKAFAISTRISAKTSTAAIASPIAAVSSSPLRWQ